jgi:hypothetical protein
MFDFGLLSVYEEGWPVYDDSIVTILYYRRCQRLQFNCGCEARPMMEIYAKGLWAICSIRCNKHVWKDGKLLI